MAHAENLRSIFVISEIKFLRKLSQTLYQNAVASPVNLVAKVFFYKL